MVGPVHVHLEETTPLILFIDFVLCGPDVIDERDFYALPDLCAHSVKGAKKGALSTLEGILHLAVKTGKETWGSFQSWLSTLGNTTQVIAHKDGYGEFSPIEPSSSLPLWYLDGLSVPF